MKLRVNGVYYEVPENVEYVEVTTQQQTNAYAGSYAPNAVGMPITYYPPITVYPTVSFWDKARKAVTVAAKAIPTKGWMELV